MSKLWLCTLDYLTSLPLYLVFFFLFHCFCFERFYCSLFIVHLNNIIEQTFQSAFFLFHSLICQTVFALLPGRPPLHYYLCSNKIDLLQLDKLPYKLNWPLLSLLAISFAIHIFVNVKVKILKVKQQRSTEALTFSDKLKFGDISSIDNRSISNFLTSFLTVAAPGSFFVSLLVINRSNPIEFNKVTKPFSVSLYIKLTL